jgi:hypothetical protein
VQLCRCAAVQVPHHVPVPFAAQQPQVDRAWDGQDPCHSVTPSLLLGHSFPPSRVGFGKASRIPPIPSIAHCGEWRWFFFFLGGPFLGGASGGGLSCAKASNNDHSTSANMALTPPLVTAMLGRTALRLRHAARRVSMTSTFAKEKQITK